jgi:hypothetical protein
LLEGLIVIENKHWDKSITFAHSSVKDYFLSTQFQQQFSSIIDLKKDVSQKFITQTCVCYLLLFADPKHSMTEDTLPNYPISLYAAKYWFHHLQLCNAQDQEVLFPSTMHLMEDGSRQYAAFYYLHSLPLKRFPFFYNTRVWDEPIPPALWMCHKMGYTMMVQSLLIEHNTCVDVATTDGKTSLHLALEQGHPNFAKLLIQHNASVDLATNNGWTALHFALEKGHIDIAKLLIEHNASVDLATNDGRTPLHLALVWGHLGITRLLIEHNASVDLAINDGRIPLHLLPSLQCHLDIARLLVEHNTIVNQFIKNISR